MQALRRQPRQKLTISSPACGENIMLSVPKGTISHILNSCILCLSPALSLACQDTPVDGPTDSVAAPVLGADASSNAILLASGAGDQGDPHGRQPQHRLDRLFQRFDKDGDGKIALADLPEPLRQRMAPADTNGDGQITRDEFTKAREQFAAERKKQLDTDGDGVISDQERAKARAAFVQKRFERADRNNDGALTADEVPARMWQHISVADVNSDGKVTLEEFEAAHASGKPGPEHRMQSGNGARR
jgi:Ca2+-binding EF-hand superfamily protein